MNLALSGSVVLAVTGAATPVLAAENAPVAIATVASPDAAADRPVVADRGYVIVDIPASAGLRRAGPEGGFHAADERDAVAALPGPVYGAGAVGDVSARPGKDGFDADVIAVHDERIALLKRRIEAVRGEGAADSDRALGDLAARLRRAEAARTLSADRAGIRERCCDMAGGAVAAPIVRPHDRSERPGAASRAAVSKRADAVVPSSERHVPVTTASHAAVPNAVDGAALSTPVETGVGTGVDRQSDDAMQRAGVLLATARRVLEAPSGAGHAPDFAAAPVDPASMSWSGLGPIQQLALALASLLIALAAARGNRPWAGAPAKVA